MIYGPSRDEPGKTLVIRSDCKRLTCETCGPRKTARYRDAVVQHAIARNLTKFLTLTLDPAHLAARNLDSSQSVDYIRNVWAKFRVYLGRKFPKVEFIAVVELQKNGNAHLHVLMNRWIAQSWISDTWDDLGGGKIVHIKTADLHRVAGYVSKYLTKDVLLSVPKGKKRISASHGIRLIEKRPGWKFLNRSIAFLSVLAGELLGPQKTTADHQGTRSFTLDADIGTLIEIAYGRI